MLDDEQLEDMQPLANEIYLRAESMNGFVNEMLETYHNVPKYILRIIFISKFSFHKG